MDISILLWLQGIRESATPLIRAFFSFLGIEALIAGAFVVPCIVYWSIGKRAGQFSLLVYGASSVCNQLIKNTVCAYRPWIRDARILPDQSAIAGAEGYSFPSGHPQSVTSILGGLVWPSRRERRWPLILTAFLIALVMVSRLFLGVHAPQDVLVGLLVGGLFVVLGEPVVRWIEAQDGRDLKAVVVGCILTVLYLVYVTVKPYPVEYVNGKLLVDPVEMTVSCYKLGGVFIGILIGWVIERRYICFGTEGVSRSERVLRSGVGLIIIAAAYVLPKNLLVSLLGVFLGQFVRHALVFLLLFAGIPALFEPLGRASVRLSQG